MLNNNPNPLRAAYPELGNRTAMEALRGAGIYVGPGPVPDWAKVQLDPMGGDVVTTAAGVACTPPAGMPGVTDVQKAVDALVPYEVGAWSAKAYFSGQSTPPAQTLAHADYMRIGRMVAIWCRILLTDLGEEKNGQLLINGLPYPATKANPYPAVLTTLIHHCDYSTAGLVASGVPNIYFYKTPYNPLARADVSADSNIWVTGTYIAEV